MRTYSTSGVAEAAVGAGFTLVPVLAGSAVAVLDADELEVAADWVAFALPAVKAPVELTGDSDKPRWVD
ncbi:MAG: hypothetical protein AAGC57_04145 [Pseudomonadota bacterium]